MTNRLRGSKGFISVDDYDDCLGVTILGASELRPITSIFREAPHVVVRTIDCQNQCSNACICIVQSAGQVGFGAGVIIADREPEKNISHD